MARVSGPVTGGSRGWPFGGPVLDLAARGYQETEFFLEGTATRYKPRPGTELGMDGRWDVEPAETVPFKTRFVVYRPIDPPSTGRCSSCGTTSRPVSTATAWTARRSWRAASPTPP